MQLTIDSKTTKSSGFTTTIYPSNKVAANQRNCSLPVPVKKRARPVVEDVLFARPDKRTLPISAPTGM
jgi:hypothetical protein